MRAQPAVSDDGLFPARFLREDERRLVELALSRDFGMQRWLSAGPRFFTSGFAVMLASLRGFDRPRLLALAEQLHPGGTQAEVFALWLTRAPFRPARFVSLLASPGRHAA